ncbi:glycoside hydrolase family 13 protein [Tamlana fucoidanivorans]|nr:glycoside hydrolase family 13 protein [Tamlana fucoidanivorans]
MTVNSQINRVEPAYWWIGFKDTSLQLLVHHPDISLATPVINHEGVTIENIHKADSPNYMFIDLNIHASTKPGFFDIVFNQKGKETLTYKYELKQRERLAEAYQGFDSSDAIYLITPDRFANGNPENDIVETLLEKTIDRSDDYARHGGDIQGIINHLDYIDDLGFTAIWSSPLLTNNMASGSYHGYAITDYYEIDPRYGTFQDYKLLSDQMAKRGMKLIIDQVANHCGLEHWWMKDLPFKDWVNYQKNYEKNKDNWNSEITKRSNHKRTTNQDPYAASSDKDGMVKGWFVETMPDLNQRNPFMAKYIIQNSIWWIEACNLGGIRQDTYPYPDKEFMSVWAGTIMNEYPNFSIVGEEWSYNPLIIGYWQRGAKNHDGYESNLRSPMDFAMQATVVSGLNEADNWNEGLIKIYEGLANDFHYTSAQDLMVFPDNHDMSRIYTQLKGDVANTKMAVSYLLVIPRIPQIYYGTEILMDDFKNPGDHGLVRTDFPGGWDGDTVNAFTGEGLTETQKGMQYFLKQILNYRKNSKAIHNGKTVHFSPENGVYVLFRVFEDEIVMHIINKNEAPVSLELKRFKEMNVSGKTFKNIITSEELVWKDVLELTQKGSVILTTKLN